MILVVFTVSFALSFYFEVKVLQFSKIQFPKGELFEIINLSFGDYNINKSAVMPLQVI